MKIDVICFITCSHRLSDGIQRFKLFTATTVMVNTSTMISAYLSMNSELMLEEPLSVASVITFGIGGDCILEELIVNASIDDIYGNSYKYSIVQ